MKLKESRTEALRNTEGYFESLKDEDDTENWIPPRVDSSNIQVDDNKKEGLTLLFDVSETEISLLFWIKPCSGWDQSSNDDVFLESSELVFFSE